MVSLALMGESPMSEEMKTCVGCNKEFQVSEVLVVLTLGYFGKPLYGQDRQEPIPITSAHAYRADYKDFVVGAIHQQCLFHLAR